MVEEHSRPILEVLASDPVVLNQVKALISSQPIDGPDGSDPAQQGLVLESVFGNQTHAPSGMQLDVVSGGRQPGLELDVVRFDRALPRDRMRLEAIVEVTGRPPLLIQNNDWLPPVIDEISVRLESAREKLALAIPAVGRIDIVRSGTRSMVGTGWFVDDRKIVTNAHVARKFIDAARQGDQAEYSFFEPDVLIDTIAEHNIDTSKTASVIKVLHMEPKGSPHDIAVLEVREMDGSLPESLILDDAPHERDMDVAAIGYPAKDPRNDFFVMLKYFQNIYDVKRLSPGKLITVEHEQYIEHDCTTLGGSSGSAIINLANGCVAGLHFAGEFKDRNFALKSKHLRKYVSV